MNSRANAYFLSGFAVCSWRRKGFFKDVASGIHFELLSAYQLIHCRDLDPAGDQLMQAIVDGEVIAHSDDIVECQGYQYFPRSAVRIDRLEKAEKTQDDHACPHGVQFYDVIVGGKRHPRAAWSYEAPQPKMHQVADRFGFWQDVEVK
jgi:uncharacterized protein (DUF427 family)